jgi:hypothetical protein
MKRNHFLTIAALALLVPSLLITNACKSSGMAVTARGQLFKINIIQPTNLLDHGEDNLDVVLSNRGVNNVNDIFLDVEVPPDLVVLDQTNERGVTASREPGTNVYHFTLGKLQPLESSTVRFHVRTAAGTMAETGTLRARAWQKDLPGQSLLETAVIRLRA